MNIQQNKIMKKHNTRWKLVFFDVCVIAIVSGLMLGFGIGGRDLSMKGVLLQFVVLSLCLFVSRFIFKVYRQIWRYGGVESYIKLMIADGIGCIIYYAIQKFLSPTLIKENLPAIWSLGLCAAVLMLSLFSRLVYRYAYKKAKKDTLLGRFLHFLLVLFIGKDYVEFGDTDQKIKIAIVGAGSIGTALCEELMNNKKSAYLPKCFIEIDRMKAGRMIYGIPVIHESDVDADLLKTLGVQEIVIAVGSLSAEKTKELYDQYSEYGCKLKVYDYPTMESAESGRRHMREFDIEELLFRRPLDVTDETANAYYKNKVVMITGGGGSIGSELCRQIAKMEPKRLIVVDNYENGAYELQQELKFKYENALDIRVEIVSVCNRAAIDSVFAKYRPEIVIHAAAHKHVPFMEHNCVEAVENNVFGTLNTVEVAEKYGAQRFIMVSTDKAVNPTNVMGATKRMCEMIVLSHAKNGGATKFSATRFGNVLGSAGSVIPLFKRQIAAGGPVTVTDKRIIRYFMTIPEASQLVLQSGVMANSGELFVLDMGKPVKILDLAENMIRLSGLTPYKDIDIIETGLRPGEKLYEELLVKTEELDRTDNSLIFIERDQPLGKDDVASRLKILSDACKSLDNEVVKAALKKVVETYRDPSEINECAEQSSEMQCVR